METDVQPKGSAPHGRASAVDRLLDAVAQHESVDPLELPPLYDVVDPEALDNLFESVASGPSRPLRVELTYAGCDVVVEARPELRCSVTDADS